MLENSRWDLIRCLKGLAKRHIIIFPKDSNLVAPNMRPADPRNCNNYSKGTANTFTDWQNNKPMIGACRFYYSKDYCIAFCNE
jgi:hypothetical protein